MRRETEWASALVRRKPTRQRKLKVDRARTASASDAGRGRRCHRTAAGDQNRLLVRLILGSATTSVTQGIYLRADPANPAGVRSLKPLTERRRCGDRRSRRAARLGRTRPCASPDARDSGMAAAGGPVGSREHWRRSARSAACSRGPGKRVLPCTDEKRRKLTRSSTNRCWRRSSSRRRLPASTAATTRNARTGAPATPFARHLFRGFVLAQCRHKPEVHAAKDPEIREWLLSHHSEKVGTKNIEALSANSGIPRTRVSSLQKRTRKRSVAPKLPFYRVDVPALQHEFLRHAINVPRERYPSSVVSQSLRHAVPRTKSSH